MKENSLRNNTCLICDQGEQLVIVVWYYTSDYKLIATEKYEKGNMV